jgi:hypothetical protein
VRFHGWGPAAALLLTLSSSHALAGDPAAVDPQTALDETLKRALLPRPLNAADAGLPGDDLQPLLSPAGDFNLDGHPDVAVAGVYDLSPSATKYFLLIATRFDNPVRYQKLFYEESARPVFLHKAGTTGAGDLGHQAFSLSNCMKCSDGYDVQWNPDGKKFKFVKWAPTRTAEQISAAPPVRNEKADKALRVVGALPDVNAFVKELEERKGSLGTRVDPGANKKEVRVTVFEQAGEAEKVYDVFTVDVDAGTVTHRERTIKAAKTGKSSSRHVASRDRDRKN